MGRILAIESNPARAQMLRESLEETPAELEIVANARDAIQSITRCVPQLVITSTFLSPADEALLTAHVRQMPLASHLQVIDLPYFDADQRAERSNRKVLNFFRRGSRVTGFECDASVVRTQIEQYLQQAVTGRPDLRDRMQTALVRVPKQSALLREPQSHAGTQAGPFARTPASVLSQRDDRRRARRRRREDLPSLWAAKLPSISDLGIVDISTTGVLLETASKITPGTTVDLQLVGQDINLNVPARTIRSEVARVSGLGVRYRVAAAFSRELNLLELQPAELPALAPKALAELLARVLGEVDRLEPRVDARARFETGLRRLLPVRDIQVRRNPMINEPGTESIYFTVPHGSGSPQILQATFDAGHELSSMEFRFLKAAANVAAAVLELAPASAGSQGSVSQ